MSFGSIWDKLLFVGLIIVFIYLFSFMRRRDPKKARAEIVRSLLSETRMNLAMLKAFDNEPLPRSFETTAWQLNKKKIGFLEKSLQADLQTAFQNAMDYDRRLKAAKKNKSNEQVIPDQESLKPPFLRVKEGLEDWLLVHEGRIDAPLQFSTMFDGLFGSR